MRQQQQELCALWGQLAFSIIVYETQLASSNSSRPNWRELMAKYWGIIWLEQHGPAWLIRSLQ